MTELPSGWDTASLGELGVEAQGGFPSGRNNSDGLGIPHLRPMNVDRAGQINLSEVKYVEEARDLRVCSGDVLFNNTNSPSLVGKTAFFNHRGEWAFSNHMTRLRPPQGLEAKFLAVQLHYMWSCGVFQHLCSNHVNQASISTKTLRQAVRVVVPPTNEQRKIVAAIEEQFSRLDAGVTALERIRQNLKRMRAAVLQAAIRGALVKPNASEPSLAKNLPEDKLREPLYEGQPGNWVTTSISAIAGVTSGATPSRSRQDYWHDGTIPWVTSALVNRETIAQAKEFVTELALRETSVKLMLPGTLLVAMYGEGQTRGRCSELLVEATTNQACASIVLQEPWSFIRPYLKLILMASYEANRRLSAGGVQPNLSVGIIKELIIALPPKNEQRRICDEASRQLSFIRQLEGEVERQYRRASSLRSSVLAAAFSGGLVSQYPNDEPVSALLKRISAKRALSSGHKPAKAGRRRKVAT